MYGLKNYTKRHDQSIELSYLQEDNQDEWKDRELYKLVEAKFPDCKEYNHLTDWSL